MLIFCCVSTNFIARAHLSVTIVAMADIPKENYSIVLHQNISENFTNFSNDSHIEVNFNNTVIDLNEFGGEIDGLSTGNKLNDSIDDTEDLLNVNNTENEEKQYNTNLHNSIWNIYKVSFKKVLSFYSFKPVL